MKRFFLAFIAIITSISIQSQTADEIIDNYFENTGGKENWSQLKGMKISASVNQQGMEIPLEIYQMADGKQMQVINFQGKEIKQGVFDGTTLWNTNFMTMKAEKSDAESTENMKLEMNDFPDSFLNYKEKGYTVELLGEETIDGTETFKLKLTKEPMMVDGKEEESVEFYFFDKESFVPIAVQSEIKSGPAKGMISQVTMSDYDEVDGLYFPFSMSEGVKGSPGAGITISKIELNPQVDDKEFMFPEQEGQEK